MVFGARVVSSAMSKLPQLVCTTAVSSSPFFTVCFGAFRVTFFGSGASTFLQPLGAVDAVVESVVESLAAAAAGDQDRGDHADRDRREDGEDDPALSVFSPIGAGSLKHIRSGRMSTPPPLTPLAAAALHVGRPGAGARGRVRRRRGDALPRPRVPAGAGPRRRPLRGGGAARRRRGSASIPRAGSPSRSARRDPSLSPTTYFDLARRRRRRSLGRARPPACCAPGGLLLLARGRKPRASPRPAAAPALARRGRLAPGPVEPPGPAASRSGGCAIGRRLPRRLGCKSHGYRGDATGPAGQPALGRRARR